MADEVQPTEAQVTPPSMFGEEKEAATKASAERVAQEGASDKLQPADQKATDAKPEVKPEPPVEKPAEKPAEKPEEKKATETKDAEKPKEDKPKPPERYDLKLAENSLLDRSAIDKIEAYAKAQGLSQADAEAVLKASEEDVASFVETRKTQWKQESIADREIGGERLNESVLLAKGVLDRFGNETLRRELDRTGYGNHPELLRMLVKIGKAAENDKAFVPKSYGPVTQATAADKLYDNPRSR